MAAVDGAERDECRDGRGRTRREVAQVIDAQVRIGDPAAGVVGVVHLARALGCDQALAFDMGGTTAKAAMIENGEPFRATEYEIGAPISTASRLLKGGGYMLKIPAIDIAEVGAGGGSMCGPGSSLL